MNKRLYFLFIFLVLLTSVFIWRKPIAFHTTRLGFKYFSEKTFGEKVSFHDFELKKNKLILIEPKLGSKNRAVKKGGVYLEAESATIDYQIDWFKRSIKLALNLQKPKIHVIKTTTFKPTLKGLFKESVWFQVQATFKIEAGKLELIDKTSSSEILSQNFQFDAESQEISPSYSMICGKFFQGASSYDAAVSLKESSTSFNLDLKDTQVSELQDMLNFWASSLSKQERSLNCSKGMINGSLSVSIVDNYMPLLESKFEVRELHLDDKKTLLSVHVPKAMIDLKTTEVINEKQDYTFKDLLGIWIDSSQGAIKIPYGAQVLYQKNKFEILKSKDMKGQITFNQKEPLRLHLEGNVTTGDRQSLLILEGSGYLKMFKGDLEVRMKNHFKDEARIRCSVDPSALNQHKFYAQITNFSEEEAEFVQQLLMPFYPEAKAIEIQKGRLDANFRCTLQDFKAQDIEIDDFQIKEGYFKHIEWIEGIKNISARGRVKMHLSHSNPFKTASGEIQFKALEISTHDYRLDQIEGSTEIVEGQIAKSKASAYFANLKTNLDWDKQKKVDPLNISLSGSGEDFLRLSPNFVTKHYESIFEKEEVEVELNGVIEERVLNLKGKCTIGQFAPAFFGFNIHSRKNNGEQNEQFRIFWQNFISPLKIAPALSYFERKFNLHFPTEYSLQGGWFTLKNVPVEKFISPIIFGSTSLKLSGTANLQGEFDQQGLSLSYDQYNLNLDHGTFSIDFESSSETKNGHHYFNFTKGTHFGDLNVEGANFLMKYNNLTFTNLNGNVEITPEYIYVPKIDAVACGLSIASELKLRYSASGDLDFRLNLNEFNGKFSDFKSMFHTLGYTYIDQLPFSGELKINPKDVFFELQRRGEELSTRIALAGELINGSAPFISQKPLTKVGCKFAFDSDTQIFEIKDFEGVWKSHRKQKYELYSNYLKINLFNDDPCHFDVKIKNSYKDCARLIGKLYLNVAQKKPTLKIVLDQKNNHVGSVGLTNVYFALDESFNLDYLNINFSGNLLALQQDVSLLQNALPQLSSTSLTAFKWLNLDGELSGQWVYDLSQKRHQFFIWGDQVKIGQAPGGFFQLKGYQNGNSTIVEDLTYHDLKGGFKIEEKPFCYFIKDLKLSSNQNFDLQLSGIYCKIFNSFQADVKRLYCNLDQIKTINPLSENKYLKDSSGKLDINGKVEGGYFKGDINYSSDFKGKTYGLKIHDLLFQDDKIEGSITGNSQTFKIVHFKSRFLAAFQEPLEVTLVADNLEFSSHSPFKVGNIHFSMPVKGLRSIRSILKDQWQLSMPQSSFEIKKEGLLEGDVYFDPKNPNYSFALKLKKDSYNLAGHDYYLDKCRLDYGPLGLKVAAQTSFENKPYWFNYSKESFKQDAFTLTAHDHDPIQNLDRKLKIECQEEAGSMIVKSIKGSIAGLRWDFVHRPEKDTPDSNALMGQLQMHGEELIDALPENIGSKLKSLDLGKGYFLTGQLTLPKNNFKKFLFEGLFGGQSFDLLGFEFKSLSSIISCTKDQVKIKDFKLSDLSGELCMDSVNVDKSLFSIPKISLKDFKPSLLHRSNQGPVKHKPLIIDEFEVSNLKGDFNNLDTVKGDGYFTFQKSLKKQASLLDIPVHLITKLGLDLTMLNPVEGKVMFMFKDQKIILTKLIDVYSHDRRCHFTLAKQPDLSYMDFDGSLNIKIKMKQYVLLKITEPFIISVRGSCAAPRYSFMRKKVVVDVPEKSPL